MDLEITLHLIELGLFLLMLFFIKIGDTKIIKKQPLKTLALLTIVCTILGGLALCVFDMILFIQSIF